MRNVRTTPKKTHSLPLKFGRQRRVIVPQLSPKRFYGHGIPGVDAHNLRGRLIVVEGADGSGRSTQIAQLVHWLEGSGLIPYLQVQVNLAVFGWGLLLAVVFGLLSGVIPAWKMSRLHPVQALKGAA